MKSYIGTKKLKAKPMNRGNYNNYRGWTIPKNEDPEEEGYLVEYEDSKNKNHPLHQNYISWSPKEVFEKAYRQLEAMTFGEAIEAMKVGLKVSRAGWNGKGMYLYHVAKNSYPAITEIAKKEFGESVPYGAYIAMKTAQGNVVPWLLPHKPICFLMIGE